jgi:YVTN family beta-propeller protein
MLYDAKSLERLATIEVGKNPAMAVFTKDGQKAYVSNGGDATLSVIDVKNRKVVGSIPNIGKGAMGLVMSPDGGKVLVTGGGENKYTLVETATGKILIDVVSGKEAHGAVLTPDAKFALVPNRQSGDVSIVDMGTGKIVDTVANVGDKSDIIDVSPDGTRAFVTLRGDAVTGDPAMTTGKEPGVSVIDVPGRKVVTKISLGGDPHGIAVRP